MLALLLMTPHWCSQLHTTEIWTTNLNHVKGFCWAKTEWNNPLEKPNCRWEDNIKMYLTEREWEVVDWTRLTEDRGNCQSLVKAVVITLNTCQYPATVTSKAQTRDITLVSERAKQRNSCHRFECNKELRKGECDRWCKKFCSNEEENYWMGRDEGVCLSVCVLKFWTIKGIPR